MSEIALTLVRWGFLALLWLMVIVILNVMRKDLKFARPVSTRREAVTPARSPNTRRQSKVSTIEIESADGVVRLFNLVDGMTIGRGTNNSIQIDDDFASTQHASISLDDRGWTYTDLGSTNGSWMNKKRITDPVVLKRGTGIRIGQTELRFQK